MSLLRTIAVRWKILLLAAVMTLGVVVLSVLSFTGLSSVARSSDGIAQSLPELEGLSTIDSAKAEYRGAALAIVMSPKDPEVLKDSRGTMKDAAGEVDDSLADWKDSGVTPALQQQVVGQWASIQKLTEKEIARAR